MRIAGFAPESRVNGPGRRIVVWAQGCDLACAGCFNPSTHPHQVGEDPTPSDVAARIFAARGPNTAGVTFSGGEPFQQAAAFAEVARAVRRVWPEVRVMAFTGYRIESLHGADAPAGSAALLSALDWLIDGPYDPRQRVSRAWRASANQRLWVVGQPLPPETLVNPPPDAELVVTEEGAVLLSGFPDANLRRAVEKLGT